MKYFLAVETSTPSGGLVLTEYTDQHSPTKVLAHREWSLGTSHSEIVTAATRSILSETKVGIDEVNIFGVGIGPGSFTGIRVGLNMMRAFAYSFARPLLTCSSLQALALSTQPQPLPVLCLVNAYKNMVYAARYRWTPEMTLQEEISPRALLLEQLPAMFQGIGNEGLYEPALVIGSGFAAYQESFPSNIRSLVIRDADQPDEPLVQKFYRHLDFATASVEQNNWRSAKPLYIRASEAEEKLKQGLLKPLPII